MEGHLRSFPGEVYAPPRVGEDGQVGIDPAVADDEDDRHPANTQISGLSSLALATYGIMIRGADNA